MIVVVGSRHDPISVSLAARWGAALCGADDLTSAGWAWRPAGAPRVWRVDGSTVDDREIRGVLVRRSSVYPEELTTIHPDDRAYVAAECHAFLSLVLATTAARVCNPVVDGAFGDEALGFARVRAAAAACGLSMRPQRLASSRRRSAPPAARWIEVVGARSFGEAPPRDHAAARALTAALDVAWASVAFDGRHRLLAISSSRAPGDEAATALGTILRGDP